MSNIGKLKSEKEILTKRLSVYDIICNNEDINKNKTIYDIINNEISQTSEYIQEVNNKFIYNETIIYKIISSILEICDINNLKYDEDYLKNILCVSCGNRNEPLFKYIERFLNNISFEEKTTSEIFVSILYDEFINNELYEYKGDFNWIIKLYLYPEEKGSGLEDIVIHFENDNWVICKYIDLLNKKNRVIMKSDMVKDCKKIYSDNISSLGEPSGTMRLTREEKPKKEGFFKRLFNFFK